MGMVLSFSPRVVASGDSRRHGAEPASVIIFPGVRYERLEDGQHADAPARAAPPPAKPAH